jgi:lipid-A-disaccharide synthase-like uncharacterized protein
MTLGLPPLAWDAIGLAGQLLFTARFVVQWVASERRGESVVPRLFWWLSIAGSAILAAYAAALGDPVFLAASLLNGAIYLRNVVLIGFGGNRATPRRILLPAVVLVAGFVLWNAWPRAAGSIPPGWLLIGFAGTVCWSGRFVIQWYASERAGESVMPRAFWYAGLVGCGLLLAYAVLRREPVFILGYLFPPIPYVRNLVLIYRREGTPVWIGRIRERWRTRRRFGVALGIGILVVAMSAKVLTSKRPAGDFLRYHRAGRIVATGNSDRLYEREPRFQVYDDPGLKEMQFRYLPAFAVLMAPLGALPVKAAESVWAVWNALAWIATLVVGWRFVRRYGVRPAWMWLPFLLTVRFGWDNINLGQINPTIVLCATAGLVLVESGRPRAGGLLTALGATIKFTPLFLVLLYLVRGRGRAVVWSLAGVALLAGALPAAVLGPARAARLTGEVWRQQGEELLVAGVPEDVPGESLRAMTYRLLGPMPYVRRDDTLDTSLHQLDHAGALWLYRGLALALAAVVVVFARRRRWEMEAPLVYGAALCAMLLISPETRQPHFLLLVLPASAVAMLIGRGRFATGTDRVLAGLFLGALFLAALPSRGIVGHRATLLLSAFCSTAVAASLLLVACRVGVALINRESPPGRE